MQDDILTYYESELRFIRHMAAEFAAKYPGVASRLELEEEKCEDPHVERLIEAFALLAARVRYKIDDEFPEITEALLGLLYPHYLRPIPSMSIVQFELDREHSKITSGYRVPAGTPLRSKPVSGVPVEFRTCYPLTLWPIEVASASLVRSSALAARAGVVPANVFAAIRIELKTFGGARFSELDLTELRFYLNGDGEVTHSLHELIFCNTIQVAIRNSGVTPGSGVSILERQCIGPVGYGRDEGLLPYGERSFLGYRLLQEYFCFPQKFLFFDIRGIDRLARPAEDRVELIIFLNEFGRRERLPVLERSVNADTFQLGCSPAVNLFQRRAEPIRVTHADSEYRVVADGYHETAMEVYSVDRVLCSRPDTDAVIEFHPFYSFRHSYSAADPEQTAFWVSTRRASFHKDDNGTEVYLSLVDTDLRPTAPPNELLTVHITCTNRDLPGKLPFTGVEGEFEAASGPLLRIRCRYRPTETLRPAARRGLQWRLISHLSLNSLSLSEGREALQEILKLYDFSDDPAVRRQIGGITRVANSPQVARLNSQQGVTMCLGTQVEVEFDEEQFVGSGAFLMASVLERFFGLYSSINSFTQLRATTRQRKGVLKIWPPRAGEQILA